MRKTNSLFFLQLSLALVFIAFGIAGLISYNSSLNEVSRALARMFGSSTNFVPVVVSIVELIAGAFLLLVLFVEVSPNAVRGISFVILVLWIVNIVIAYFANGIFQPTFFAWLYNLAPNLVILCGLWAIMDVRDGK